MSLDSVITAQAYRLKLDHRVSILTIQKAIKLSYLPVHPSAFLAVFSVPAIFYGGKYKGQA